MTNYTEILIREVFSEYKKNYKVCPERTCQEDIIKIVLNKLPSKYFLSTESEGVKKAYLLNKQLRLQALIEITAAVAQVNPS